MLWRWLLFGFSLSILATKPAEEDLECSLTGGNVRGRTGSSVLQHATSHANTVPSEKTRSDSFHSKNLTAAPFTSGNASTPSIAESASNGSVQVDSRTSHQISDANATFDATVVQQELDAIESSNMDWYHDHWGTGHLHEASAERPSTANTTDPVEDRQALHVLNLTHEFRTITDDSGTLSSQDNSEEVLDQAHTNPQLHGDWHHVFWKTGHLHPTQDSGSLDASAANEVSSPSNSNDLADALQSLPTWSSTHRNFPAYGTAEQNDENQR